MNTFKFWDLERGKLEHTDRLEHYFISHFILYMYVNEADIQPRFYGFACVQGKNSNLR